MTAIHLVLGLTICGSFLLVGALGAWSWWRGEPSVLFWQALRVGQGALVVQVALGGILLAGGREPSGSLHVLYGVLPLVVSFIAEQLRIASAETVLEQRGFGSSAEVGELPEADQRAVVLAIVRRETAVMTIAAFVVCFLALRAASTAGAL